MNGTRIVVIMVLAVVALTLLRYRPWERSGDGPTQHSARSTQHAERREALTVGFLPVT